MADIIKDGTGTGSTLKIDNKHRLHSTSVAVPLFEDAIINGNYYGLSTGILTLTSDSESALLYIQNNSDFDIYLETVHVFTGVSTGGSGEGVIRLPILPTSGDIITTGIETVPFNTNFGSANVLDADVRIGSEGKTLTGVANADFITNGESTSFTSNLRAIIPKGKTAGLNYIPPAGNTSMRITVQINLILIDNELKD